MTDMYVLDAAGNPRPESDTRKWGEAFADGERRTVARDSVGEVDVSTVFLGMDHGWGGALPVLWETMVFGGDLDGEQDRYTSREAAVAGHAAMLARVRAAQSAPTPEPARGTVAQLAAIAQEPGNEYWFPSDRLTEVAIATPADLAAAIDWAFGSQDTESGHALADALLLRYINDPQVTEAFDRREKWYA